MPDSRYPDFFIVGAARSGTTSLWQYLRGHPEIFMPRDELFKEPAYFCRVPRVAYPNYCSIFKAAGSHHKAVGEASTAYLTDSTSALRIRDAVPRAKIIIMLRNPAERAFSLYRWMVQEGYEYSATFEKALAREQKRSRSPVFERANPEYFWNFLYFQSGLYCRQVRRYFDAFPASRIHVIVFEEFIRDTQRAYRRVCRFLGVDGEAHRPPVRVYNSTRAPVYPPFQYLVRKLNNRLLRWRPAIRSKRSRDLLLPILLRSKKPKMPPRLRAELLNRYHEDIGELEDLLGRSLPWRGEGP